MKILIVDDEAPIRAVAQRVLRSAGFDADTASSADDASARLNEDWELVLTDVNMPGRLNGLDLLKKVKDVGRADVLVMTASPELDSAVEALRHGAYDYIIKPFTPDILLAAVRRCVDKRQLSKDLVREKALRAELERAHEELARLHKVGEAFGQFVTPEVARFVLAQPKDQWKKGALKTVTVLFADVRRFTPFAGDVAPDVAVDALNRVFSCVVPAVQEEGGILNKFIGDGMLALFGAPMDLPGHPVAAARAAARAVRAVDALSAERAREGLPPLRIGVGINTGPVVAGCLGTSDRTEYSVIGHTVNLASRLEETAAPGQILAGPDTARELAGALPTRAVAPVTLAGIAKPVAAVEILASSGAAR